MNCGALFLAGTYIRKLRPERQNDSLLGSLCRCCGSHAWSEKRVGRERCVAVRCSQIRFCCPAFTVTACRGYRDRLVAIGLGLVRSSSNNESVFAFLRPSVYAG